jgi:subtilisin family serine protease
MPETVRAVMTALCAVLLIYAAGSGTARAQEGGDAPLVIEYPTYHAPAKAKKSKAKASSTRRTGAAAKTTSTRRAASGTSRSASRARNVARAPVESAPSGMPPEGENRFIGDQVIVRFRLSARQSGMDALVARLNLLHLDGRTVALAGVTVHLYQITDGTLVRAVIAALEADGTVVAAQPNYRYELSQSAAGAAQSPQYALAKLDIAPAHELATGAGVPVAVIDSMVDKGHPEFRDSAIELMDATGADSQEAHAHGTSVAGVIAAHGSLTGIAPGVRLIGIRAFLADEASGAGAYGTSWRVLAALDDASEAGARVVNMSFAGPEDPLVGRSVGGAVKRGIIAIAAAGNGGPTARPLYPAAYPGVIAVTAIDKDDLVYAQANQGDYVALAAPGVDILVPVPDSGYQVSSGTSIAAAHVSGLAALVLSRQPDLTAAQVTDILLGSSADLGAPGRDVTFGAGLPDALAAIKASQKAK